MISYDYTIFHRTIIMIVETDMISTVWMNCLTIKFHKLLSDWSVRPITRTEFLCKNVPRYFGKVQLKSNMCIIWYDWVISPNLFFTLVCKVSFLIIKRSGIREELSFLTFFLRHNWNKIIWKNIFLVSSHSCTSPVCSWTSPTSTFTFTYHICGRRFPVLEIWQ